MVKLHRTQGRKNLCFSASRDHSILLWDLEKVAQNTDEKQCIAEKIDDAHQGWIWGLSLRDDRAFYTTSWDNSIKQWEYAESRFEVAFSIIFFVNKKIK